MSSAASTAGYLYASGRLRVRAQKTKEQRRAERAAEDLKRQRENQKGKK